MDEKNEGQKTNPDGIAGAVRVLPPGLSLLLASVVRAHRLLGARSSVVRRYSSRRPPALSPAFLKNPHIPSHFLTFKMGPIGVIALIRAASRLSWKTRTILLPTTESCRKAEKNGGLVQGTVMICGEKVLVE
jgi:hypothetical protein